MSNFTPLSFLPTNASVALQTPLGIEVDAAQRNNAVPDVDDGNVAEATDAAIAAILEMEGIDDYQGTNWFEEEKEDDDEQEDRVQAFISTLRFPGPAAGPAQEPVFRSMPNARLVEVMSKEKKKPQKKAWTPCRWIFTNPDDPTRVLEPEEAYKLYEVAAKKARRPEKEIWSLELFKAECYGDRFQKGRTGQNKRQRGQPPIYVKENLIHYEDFERYYKVNKKRKPKDITDQASLNAAHERYEAGEARPKYQAPVVAEFPEESSEPEEPEYDLTATTIAYLQEFEDANKGVIESDSDKAIEAWRSLLTYIGIPESEQESDDRIAAMFREYIKWKERNGL